ncbi:hypothetical protein [Acinetobacter sp. CFCC 10889]|uniref:hypothetical protein n=1 Tax=Acinetobacter sp. CFCC 10889 TaxID=1775557 RepID=UPI0013A6A5C2|nr:hypothetical protein [Acinetobacter sp. CFCC 10889]
MKNKIICLVSAFVFSVSGSAFANTDPQIQLLKEIYQQGKKLEKGDELLALYYDNGLEQAQNNLREGNWQNCSQAWQDQMWQSQDPEYRQKPSFQKVGQNLVKVTYKVVCQGNNCKISDIIDGDGSLKKSLLNQCK